MARPFRQLGQIAREMNNTEMNLNLCHCIQRMKQKKKASRWELTFRFVEDRIIKKRRKNKENLESIETKAKKVVNWKKKQARQEWWAGDFGSGRRHGEGEILE